MAAFVGIRTIGTAVVGGMVTATVLAVFFVPVFFVAVLRLFRVKPTVQHENSTSAKEAA